MRMIADADLGKLKEARRALIDEHFFSVSWTNLAVPINLIGDVLISLERFGQEQPTPAPRIVQLTPDETRRSYPERCK